MRDKTYRARRAVHILLCATLSSTACAIEKIDAIITEHGVTYWPSSSGDSGDLDTSTSTGTSTGTSTNEVAGPETNGNSGALGSSTTSEAERVPGALLATIVRCHVAIVTGLVPLDYAIPTDWRRRPCARASIRPAMHARSGGSGG